MELQLFLAIAGAIAIFILAYRRTVNQYLKLFNEANSVIDGKLKIGVFFSTIELEGMYKGRKVLCKLEQLKEGEEAILVKIKPYKVVNSEISKSHLNLIDDIIFYEGWVIPKFSLSQKLYSKKVLKMLLDKISIECEKIEKVSAGGNPNISYQR